MTPGLTPPPLERVAECYGFNVAATLGMVDHVTDHIGLASHEELFDMGEALIAATKAVNTEFRRRIDLGQN